MTYADRALRQIRTRCLALPETCEVTAWGHPNFRAAKRTFVAFEWIEGRPSIAFRLNPTDVDLLLRRKGFFATPYGRGGWVSLWADGSINWRLVERLLERSYRLVALKRMITALDHPKPSDDTARLRGSGAGRRAPAQRPSWGSGRSPD